MNRVCKKNVFIVLSLLHITGCIIGVPQLDKDLDPSRPEVLVEKEVRLLERDLNGDPSKGESILRRWNTEKRMYEPWISEEDSVLLLIMVREHLSKLPYNDLYSNPYFVRAETGKVMAQFVAKRTMQHASTITNNQQRIANAAKIESNEFMALLNKNSLRNGQNLYHYFGTTFEKRVKENVMNERKY